MATPAFVRRAHALGLHVHAWTIERPGPDARLLDIGVDGIMTDETVALRDVLSAAASGTPGPASKPQRAGQLAGGRGAVSRRAVGAPSIGEQRSPGRQRA